MYTGPIWSKEINHNNKILYDEARSVVMRRKDEEGKTKTDLIREFMDFKGDKWKYLINHPRTRMALCTSGDAQWNTMNSNNMGFSSLSAITNNGYVTNANTWTVINTMAIMVSSTNAVKLPLQFGIACWLSMNGTMVHNFCFSNLPISPYVGSTNPVTISGNPFNMSGANGFSIRIKTNGATSTSYSGMTYASTGTTYSASNNIGNMTETDIPGLVPLFNSNGPVYFRLFTSGDKIGWSTNGTSWTYWNTPVPYLTQNLYFNVAVSQLNSSAVILPGATWFGFRDVSGALLNAP